MENPEEDGMNNLLVFLPRMRKSYLIAYLSILIVLIAALLSLPFLFTTVSIRASGIIRPLMERTEIRTAMAGLIDTIYQKEGAFVQKGSLLFRLKDQISGSKLFVNKLRIRQLKQFIADLQLLTLANTYNDSLLFQLTTPLYKEQARRFSHQIQEQQASLKKANRDLEISELLFRDKVISPKEFFDTRILQEKTLANYHAFIRDQKTQWEADLARYRLELLQYQDQQAGIGAEAARYEIRAPVKGIIQGINNRFTGGWVNANETICLISPEDQLIAECFIPSRDIGQIRIRQPVHFQIDAFNFHYFGTVSGKVMTIDNDYTIADNKPLIKVRCSFNTYQLRSAGGLKAELRKGLTLQARFVIGTRSLWQWILNNANDWLDPPVSPAPIPPSLSL